MEQRPGKNSKPASSQQDKEEQGCSKIHTTKKTTCVSKTKSEKFPLTAERVVVDFKLRRAKGCKTSKLWLKKKIKEKVEACYGKGAAQKFQATDNWFQRFKKRRNIAFRRRSNKKKNPASDGKERV